MATVKSPLTLTKEKFGDKQKLVEAVKALATDDLWMSRTNAEKGLDHVSNAKLLRLHAVFTEVAAKFGTRAKLIDAILEVEKRTKDEGYKGRLSKFPVPRLFDQYKSSAKRAAAKAAPPKKREPKAAAPVAKKAAAPAAKKKTAAKKSASSKKPAAKKAGSRKG